MTSPAVKLANALGDANAMDSLMHDDVSMQFLASALDYAGPHRGRAAVLAFNSENFGERYFPDVDVDILTDLEAGDLSTVRFRFRARLRRTGETYDGEYDSLSAVRTVALSRFSSQSIRLRWVSSEPLSGWIVAVNLCVARPVTRKETLEMDPVRVSHPARLLAYDACNAKRLYRWRLQRRSRTRY